MPEPKTPAAGIDVATLIDYAKSLDCISCGLCLNSCPTYRLSGVESSSPRGRIHLMRAVAEGELQADASFAEEMQFCLLCRNCESVCPSGVRFGAMMETTRAGLASGPGNPWTVRVARWIGFRLILPHRLALSLASSALRFAQRSGLLRRIAPLLGEQGRSMLSLPPVPPLAERAAVASFTPARGRTRARVAMLEGCVMPELLGRVNRATAGVLAASGCDVHSARGAVCCGSLHAHNGDLEGARRLARRTIEAFDALRDERARPLEVVVNSAGCAAHMKEYGELFEHDAVWRERARAFSERVVDFSEQLAPAAGRLSAVLTRKPAIASPIAFDDPCHLCHGQGIREQPRRLLDLLPGVERVELEDSESCCGSAGIYSMLRPADSLAILAERLDALERSGARTLVTANPGCQLQWAAGVKARALDVEVLHVAEALERALDA